MLLPNSRDLMPAMLATCIDEMPHLDRLRFKTTHAFLKVAVPSRQSFVLSQVLRPRFDDERFDVVRRMLSIAIGAVSGVLTENSVRSENTEVPIIREIMVATTMSSLLVALFALVASSFRTRAALQAEILALRHQLAVFQKNVPGRLLHRLGDPLLPLRDVDTAFPSQLSAVRQVLSRDRGISSLSRGWSPFFNAIEFSVGTPE